MHLTRVQKQSVHAADWVLHGVPGLRVLPGACLLGQVGILDGRRYVSACPRIITEKRLRILPLVRLWPARLPRGAAEPYGRLLRNPPSELLLRRKVLGLPQLLQVVSISHIYLFVALEQLGLVLTGVLGDLV